MEKQKTPDIFYQVKDTNEAQPDVYRVLDAAVEAGRILLENGAEIFRVEETMKRISAHFGVHNADFYVITNALFASGDDENKSKVFAKVKYVPVRSAELRKVILVNLLSREIEEGRFTIDEVEEKLREIKKAETPGKLLQIISSGIGSAGFCIMFGGDFTDAFAALLTGLLLYVFMIFFAYPKLTKIMANFLGASLVTVSCMLLSSIGLGHNINLMIIGSIIPLIPGVAFTNGVRDIANTDFLSGTVRMLDAIIGFVSIALGVGVVLIVTRHIFGDAVHFTDVTVTRDYLNALLPLVGNTIKLLIQFFAAFIGTVPFALIFGVPKEYAFSCGLVGASGWFIYSLLLLTGLTPTEATFFGTFAAALLSRLAAVRYRCPATVFITAALLPMVPGAGIYWTAYHLVMNETAAAGASGFAAIKSVVAIVMGFIVVFELPNKLFAAFRKKRKML